MGIGTKEMYLSVLFKQLGYFNFQFRKMVDYNTPKDVNRIDFFNCCQYVLKVFVGVIHISTVLMHPHSGEGICF